MCQLIGSASAGTARPEPENLMSGRFRYVSGGFRRASARDWTLAFYSLQSAVQWGRQSCLQAAFQAAAESEPTTYEFASIFSGFVSRRHRRARLVTEGTAESRGRPLGTARLDGPRKAKTEQPALAGSGDWPFAPWLAHPTGGAGVSRRNCGFKPIV